MNDLIKRLRDTASKGVSVWGDLQMEAAKEIEILTAEREAYASAMDRMKTRLAEVEKDGLRMRWLRKTQRELGLSASTVSMMVADVREIDAAMKEQP